MTDENSSDTILGINALLNNTNLGNNTAIGYRALRLNGDGFQNTSVGAYALEKNIKTHNNTSLGYKALSESVGEYNTGVGALCGQTLKTGVKNVLLGKHADVSKLNADNQIVIGQGATGLLDNSVTLGNVNVNNVFMSQDKTAHVHCGNLSIYDDKGKRVYTLPRTAGKNGHILRTNGSGLLTWIPNVTGALVLNGLEDCTTDLLKKNMFFGLNVGANNTTSDEVDDDDGQGNTALGVESFAANTRGKYNVCYGSGTLNSNTTGDKNNAFGHYSLYNNTNGQDNVAIGFYSENANISGSYNISIGSYTGRNNNSGTNNTSIGNSSAGSIIDGSYNTCLGDQTNVGASQKYSIALGASASVSADNTMVIGGDSINQFFNNTITSILPGKTENTTLGSADNKFENIVLNLKVDPNTQELATIPEGGLYVENGAVKMKQ